MNTKKNVLFSGLLAFFLAVLVVQANAMEDDEEDTEELKVDPEVEKVAKAADSDNSDIDGESKRPEDRLFGYLTCKKACYIRCAGAGFLGNANATCICLIYRISCGIYG